MNKEKETPKQGVDGVHSDFPLTPQYPPKIKTKKEEAKEKKEEPNFLIRLYRRINKKKKAL